MHTKATDHPTIGLAFEAKLLWHYTEKIITATSFIYYIVNYASMCKIRYILYYFFLFISVNVQPIIRYPTYSIYI